MRKDKEWLKKEIGKSALSSWFDKLRLDMNIIELEFLIDELDEPETDYTMSELVKANKRLSERIDNLVKELNDKAEQTNKNPDSVRPVIPQFVADYIEKWEHEGLSIGEWFKFNFDDEKEREVGKWLYDNDSEEKKRREFLLIDAILNGYKVDKEKFYYIKLPTKTGFLYLNYDGDESVYLDYFKATIFTESEIKAIDEKYWVFAKDVTEN